MSTLIAILAAGGSSRFGRDKLTRTCAGKPLGRWAVDAAIPLGRPLVWVGRGGRPPFLPASCRYRENSRPEDGLSRSLAIAAGTASDHAASALLVLLADMPLVTTNLLRDLEQLSAPSACAHSDGSPGVPALIPSHLFLTLQGLQGDRGAAAILRGIDGLKLVHPPAELLRDVDEPADLATAEVALLDRLQSAAI